MKQIQKTAVLGAGTMGSQIAAHMANAGADVILLDIVPDDAGNDRNKLAKGAIENMKKNGRAFTDPANAERLTPGNFEDDMEKLEACDWIVEAVIENPDIKSDLYKQVDEHRRDSSVLSSNTSTIPLKNLKEHQSPELKNDLIITHFFNPPRQMRLLELASSKPANDDKLQNLINFLDYNMGKTVVPVKDTPGFIGNRLGLFWMLCGLEQALEQNVPLPMADEIMNKLGFPKTGIFGLFDMVGVDLMRELGQSLRDQLPQDDAYQSLDNAMDFLDEMDDTFYKRENRKRLPLSLQTGGYEEPPAYNVEDGLSLSDILIKKTDEAEYARSVLLPTLNYACAVLPEIAGNVHDVDTAMKQGYAWSQGPFEIIETIGVQNLINALQDKNLIVAPLLQHARTAGFYMEQQGKLYALKAKDGFAPVEFSDDQWTLRDKTRGLGPLLDSNVANLWDIGDGIACLELTTKMDTMGPKTFDFIRDIIETVQNDFRGLIIGDDDRHFSAGLNLNLILKACEQEDWTEISKIIRYGQQTMMALKRAPFPVVTAVSGKTLGGACEMALHCDAIQAHIESHIELVEVKIGVVPAWGGCKEMLIRHVDGCTEPASCLQGCERVFDIIASAKTSGSAKEFYTMSAGQDNFGISMNRNRLLPDAKMRCLKLAQNYEPPGNVILKIPGAAAKKVFDQKIEDAERGYDKKVLKYLAYVLSGGNADSDIIGDLELVVIADRMKDDNPDHEIDELHVMDLEHDAFLSLIKNKETQGKIKEVLG